MKVVMNIKKAVFIVMMALAGTTAFAQHRHHHHGHSRPVVVTVVSSRVVAAPSCETLSKNDRLGMALAYLRNNKSLSVSKYRRMTGLTYAAAEAELDAFAARDDNPIKIALKGKKKLYVI